ncbi:MAG: 23S rRNA (pseudouridine(1915)-N(3))-methyltransferase RlmH, partial [Clostridiales bacterium]|nr:23S rRNA (pseudouridine(1915)-N(3))-methyltransferase RlmH [Clostridiales bacterium]
MNITVICIGKLKERYWREAVGEYSKRLGSYCSLRIQELKEARLPAGAGPAEEEAVKIAEGEEILSRVNKDMFVVSLEIRG